jgi:DNA-binding NtrC family response regulator
MSNSDTDSTDLADDFAAHLRRRHRSLFVDPHSQFDSSGTPSADELAASLALTPEDGNIWLCGQRMLLMQAEVFGAMRRALVSHLGLGPARQLSSRLGWQAGARDAVQVSELWPQGDDASLFSAGPQLHKLKGMVDVEVIHFEIDNNRGHFYAEFNWHRSLECDEHLASYGTGRESACWMQIGYASGYASTLLGRRVIFRELSCRACGDATCHIVGKPAEEWGDIAEELAYLEGGNLSLYDRILPLSAPSDDDKDARIVGISPTFNTANQLAERVASTSATVLLTGESGVGKEMFARSLHRGSPRSDQPLIALNCATLPENLLESELFGVERGAFTGADRARPGRFERADGGTLFLDEVATLSLSAQGKLLRVLQEGELERVGGTNPIQVDVRVIAATNVDLASAVHEGRFREDLFYRLNVFPINLPPLRERREDIPLLLDYFLRKFNARHGRRIAGFTSRLVNKLLTYPFAGNIRELQNLVERGVIIAHDAEPLDINHLGLGDTATNIRLPSVATLTGSATESAGETTLAPELADLQAFLDGRQDKPGTSLAAIENMLIERALEKTGGNITRTAQLLGMSRAQINYRLKGR